MAATQIPQRGVDETFVDVEVGVDECTRIEDYAEDTGTEPGQFKSSVSGCGSHVEAWINEQFGDDVEASHTIHDEADSYTALVPQHVDLYIEVADFMTSSAFPIYDENGDDANVLFSPADSEEFEEPQLWCFSS